MEDKKRVYCLYRVSTLEQVENDDIPMQKQACHDFAERQGWEVVREFYEKGISGFKVSSQKRDAILEIQREAALGNFDILLVFMFDRLGRRDDETPFVVEWFIQNNIAVWSVNEGEQRLDNHADKLMNYIRYWQASGESIKTSIRVKAGIYQLARDGHYAGGPAPFGYRLEKCGRFNAKKGREVFDYALGDEAALDTVRTIFHKYANEGYGAYRLMKYLFEQGVVKANGKPLTDINISKILENRIYIGYIKRGEIQTYVPRLQIVDEDTFNRAQELRKMRNKKYHERRIPMTTKSSMLLSGNIFCGHCGKRLSSDIQYSRYVRKDGETTTTKTPAYSCKNGSRYAGATCQKKYVSDRVDTVIKKVLQQVFEQIRESPPADSWKKQHERALADIRNKIKTATRNASKLDKELSVYKSEVIKVIQGNSDFTAEILNQLIFDGESKLSKQAAELKCLKSELDESDSLYEKTKGEHMRIRSWSEIFDDSSIETQKMVAASLIHEVRVSRGYQIEIDFNISAREFVESVSFNDENLNVTVES